MSYRTREVDSYSSAKVTNFILIEADGHDNQYLRPDEVNVDYNDIDRIKEVIEAGNSTGSIPDVINRTTGGIIMPSSNVIGSAEIVNGWGERRLKFVLVVEFLSKDRTITTINYVQGYTDYLGVSFKGTLDPSMYMHANSVTVLSKTYNAHTGYENIRVLGNYNITGAGEEEVNVYEENVHDLRLTRPVDLVTSIVSSRELSDGSDREFDNDNGFGDDVEVIENFGDMSSVELVDRNQMLPIDHLGSVVKESIDARLSRSVYEEEEGVMDTVLTRLLPTSIFNLDFFSLIYNYKGTDTSSFKLSDLRAVLPQVDDVVETYMANGHSMEEANGLPSILSTNNVSLTNDRSIETIMSVLIRNAVSSIMSSSILSDIVFTMSNTNIGGTIEKAVLDFHSFLNITDLRTYGDHFVNMFERKVWSDLTKKNMLDVEILVSGNAKSDTVIAISVNGGEEIVFRYPTFADSTFTSAIADNDSFKDMTDGYNDIMHTTLGAVSAKMRDASKIQMNGW